jgi:Cft2 family RNA processing exonuclease
MTHPTKAVFKLLLADYVKVRFGKRKRIIYESEPTKIKQKKAFHFFYVETFDQFIASCIPLFRYHHPIAHSHHVEDMLYDEQDLQACLEKIQRINYHEEVTVDGIKFRCYNAGHVLGAAMFMFDIAGVKVCFNLVIY